MVLGSVFLAECRRVRRTQRGRTSPLTAVRAIALQEIEKTLQHKEAVDPRQYVPEHVVFKYGHLFEPSEAAKLPPQRPGFDMEIDLQKDAAGNEHPLPCGPLYDMTRELLVLWKTLRELLDKGYLRASNSVAGAPVLFVKKPGGGIRFCCDYRAPNAITRKDRYPLPPITETLRDLAKAKWFTKLDVATAFNKFRIAKGYKAKTAFWTRFGLHEWKVRPFGLTRTLAAF